MKKPISFIVALLLVVSVVTFSGCGSQPEDPGPPPDEVINPNGTEDTVSDDTQDTDGTNAYDSDILENAVSVRIGRDGQVDRSITMYNNDATNTMLGYLSNSGLLFPTYTYDDEQGFVAQNIRGTYSRDDEITIADVKAGELYLFSGGQLRFYFKDMEGVNITATPVGYYVETEGLTEAVQDAYTSNLGDIWGVDVYFWITKTID